MKKWQFAMICIGCAAWFIGSADLPFRAQREYRLAFTLPGDDLSQEVVVDNVFGKIDVRGGAGHDVRVTVHESMRATTADALARAKKEVTLRPEHSAKRIRLMVDGPFRTPDGRINWRRSLGYIVRYDLQIFVPRRVCLRLKTVNEGDIKVKDIDGDFRVSNVNGKIDLSGIRGSGNAVTVNGEVSIQFDRNPRSACRFTTVNGDILLVFGPTLAADFRLKTFNGDMLSGFPFELQPIPAGTRDRRKGRFVYRRDGVQAIRIGPGGPLIQASTLNGDITISQNKTN